MAANPTEPLWETWNTTQGRWVKNRLQFWNGREWAYSTLPDVGTKFRSPFNPYLAEGTIFQRDVSAMPLHVNSAAQAAWMAANSPLPGFGFGDATALNKIVYNIPIYVVDSTIPGFEQCRMTTGGVAAGSASDTYLNGLIPLPNWATPSPGGDKALALYDIGTGLMREYFMVVPDGYDHDSKGKTKRWAATTGGYYLAKRGLDDLDLTNYPMQFTEGGSAVVRMLNPLTQIGIDEARNGRINHALSFTCADASISPLYSWPAQSGDGHDTSGNSPAEGQHMRLPPSLDVDAKLPNGEFVYKPMTRFIMHGMQDYGGYAADKNLFVHAFNVEPSVAEEHLGRPGFWADGGEAAVQYGYAHPSDSGVIRINDFPWHLIETAPLNWGKPA